MAVMKTVRHTRTVVHELHHVTGEVGLLIQAHSVRASILCGVGRQQMIRRLTRNGSGTDLPKRQQKKSLRMCGDVKFMY